MNGRLLDIRAQFLEEGNNVKTCSLFISSSFPFSLYGLLPPGKVNLTLAQGGLQSIKSDQLSFAFHGRAIVHPLYFPAKYLVWWQVFDRIGETRSGLTEP